MSDTDSCRTRKAEGERLPDIGASRPCQMARARVRARKSFLGLSLILSACHEPTLPPPPPVSPTDDMAPTISVFSDTLMLAADTARFSVTVRDSGMVHGVGYSLSGGPIQMAEFAPDVEIRLDFAIPVVPGVHPVRIVARDAAGNEGTVVRTLAVSSARLNLVASDSATYDYRYGGGYVTRLRGTAPGMVKLEYWGSGPGTPGPLGAGEIPLGAGPDRPFSANVIPPGPYVRVMATDSQGIRITEDLAGWGLHAVLILPPAHDLFVDQAQQTIDLNLTARARAASPGPGVERVDVMDDGGEWQSVDLTSAREVQFGWSARLAGDDTRLTVRIWTEGGHVSINTFPVVRVAPPEEPGAFSSIATMWKHTCALSTGGRVYCWGDNEWTYSNGLFDMRLVPALLTELDDLGLVRTYGALTHSCGLDTDGAAFCWGYNHDGILGDGTAELRGGPVAVTGGLRFQSMALASEQTCALATDNRAYCWGSTRNPFIRQYRPAPVEVPGGIAFSSIAVSGQFCGITTGGEMFCWTQWSDPGPRRVAAPVELVQLAVGGAAICALDVAGDVWCLDPDGTLSRRVTGYGFVSIAGYCGLDGESRAFCWNVVKPPVEIGDGLRFRELNGSSYGHHACAVTFQNAAYCWGEGSSGELGNGTTYDVEIPIRVRDPSP